MCIDHPEHTTRGKGPLRPGPGPLKNHTELFRGRHWGEVAEWFVREDVSPNEFADHGTHDPARYRAALAECVVRDFANYYEHRWEDGWIVVYGDND